MSLHDLGDGLESVCVCGGGVKHPLRFGAFVAETPARRGSMIFDEFSDACRVSLAGPGAEKLIKKEQLSIFFISVKNDLNFVLEK